MKFKSDVIRELLSEEEYEGFELVEQGDWISEGKYESQECVFKFEDKFYAITDSRSGRHYTDWYYDSDDWDEFVECTEVKSVEVMKFTWVTV